MKHHFHTTCHNNITLKKILSIFLCLGLLLSSLMPADATELLSGDAADYENIESASDPASETAEAGEAADAAAIDTSGAVSENGLPPQESSNPEDTDNTAANAVSETDIPVPAETEGAVISITFFDEDGQTVLYGPVEKDLSLTGGGARYLFDTVEGTNSVPQENGVYVLPHIHNGRKIAKWTRSSNGISYIYPSLNSKFRFKESDSFTALYSASAYRYSLVYDLDGGKYTDNADPVYNSFTVDSEAITLPTPQKKGCTFLGWEITNPSAGSAYGSVITSIPAGTCIEYTYGEVQSGAFTGYQLKAKWDEISVKTPSIASVKNPKNGEVSVKLTPNAEETQPVSYELRYATKSSFPKASTHVVDLGSKTSKKLTNMPKGKTYYFAVRAYKLDQQGDKVYSSNSKTVSLKIKKGVTETKKITAKSAKLSAGNVKIDSTKNLYVKATVSKRLKSYDDFYYLVSVDPDTGKVLKQISSSDKYKTVIFQTPVRDDNGTNLINGKYALAVKTGKKKYKLISSAYFIKNPEAAADYTAPYPVTASKKGIQGSLNTELGVQQGFTNFSLNSILDGSTKYVYNGKTYYFNEPYSIQNYASNCNSLGITCSVQIMLNWPGTGSYGCLLYGTKKNAAPANLYAINASTKKSRELVEAAFSFLAERCCTENCHVDNWILGNEVNIYRQWYYAGNTGREAFMKNYANSFRILYNSVKGRNKNAHIFICTDHTWKNRSGDWGAKPFMDSFNSQIKGMNKNIQWNLAYHAYPSILYIPTTWKDSYAPNSMDADFVSPKNLSVLTSYVKKTYGKNTRIIISECGFTNASGEANQAAALAYSFYKAQFDDMIDAFIIRTERDAVGEKLTRLDGVVIDAQFGLCTADGKKRASYNVFKYMDTPQYAKYTDSALKTIGASSWKSIIPGFNDKKLKALPNR